MNEAELKQLISRAENNNIKANVDLGNYYIKLPQTKDNRRKAFYYYKRAADLGYAPAQFKVGQLSYIGDGTEKNSSTAAHYLQMAVDQNYADAQYSLACMYKNKECGYIATEQKAFQLFTKAAEQGHANAQISLGYIYFFEKKQIDQALFWWACAYAHGQSNANASDDAKQRMIDAVESGIPGGYDRVNAAIEKVKQRQYDRYTHNPK